MSTGLVSGWVTGTGGHGQGLQVDTHEGKGPQQMQGRGGRGQESRGRGWRHSDRGQGDTRVGPGCPLGSCLKG